MNAKATLLETPCENSVERLVKKRVFTMPEYTTMGRKTIKNVQVGYETYGRLNPAGDNAILVVHYFSGTSHAAGKYAADDKEAGYWDAIIGPGKAIDTDKYFVVSADTLANVSARNPNTITTGPASIDPDTGEPYGMRFPIVTIRDFVQVQKALVDALGITKLHAVAGPSMGSMQAMEWAVAFPDMVARVIAVIPAGIEADAYLVGMLNIWAAPIMLDPKWNKGDYYGKEEPMEGVASTLKTVILSGRHPGWANTACGRTPATALHDLMQNFSGKYAIETALDQVSADRAAMVDANSLLYTIKACQLFSLGHRGSSLDAVKDIKAKVLLMPAKSDLLMLPDYARKAADILKAAGKQVVYAELDGDGGHFDGLLAIGQASQILRDFLDS